MALHVIKEHELWKSKMMLYSTRWVHINPTCEITPMDSTKAFISHDFVDSDSGTAASAYLMLKTNIPTTKNTIANYGLSNFCSLYPTLCRNGYAFAEINPMSVYKNPFCVVKYSLNAIWNSSCEG